jgi:hypothetical protein
MDAATMMKMDADFGATVERALDQVRAKTYDKKYANLKAREFIPVDHSLDPGAETVTYYQYDHVAVAKLISSYAEDLPRADVNKKVFTGHIKGMANSYGYSVQELRAAALAQRNSLDGSAGMTLDQRRANAARHGFEILVDDVAFSGDSNNGLIGLNNIPNALTYTPSTKAAGGTTWAVATGLELLKDMNRLAAQSVENTSGVEAADTILLPIQQFDLLAETPLQSGVTVTVLAQFLSTNQYVKSVQSWYRLKQAGAGSANRAIAFRKDPDALVLVIPQEFEQFPMQARGLEFIVPCHGRIGGVQCFYPLTVCYMDGI